MNIHVTGVMLSNDTQMTPMLNFHPYFRETVILNNFYKIHDEKCSFLSFSTTRVKRFIWNHFKSAYFGQYLCGINIDKNNYPEETELETNPSLTVARILPYPLVIVFLAISRSVVVTTPRFLILRIWIHQKIWGGIQSLNQKSIWNEKSQLHEIDA